MGNYILRFWLGFIPLLMGAILVLVGVVGVDTLISLAGYAEWVQNMRGFLNDPPVGLFPVLIVLSAVIFAFLYWRDAQSLRGEFEQQWADLEPERTILKLTVRRAFEKARMRWKRYPPFPAKVAELAMAVKFPENLLSIRKALCEYGRPILERRSQDNEKDVLEKDLLNFCIALYPETGNSLLLAAAEREPFDVARRKLSKFWDDWGRKCLREKVMPVKYIPRRIVTAEAPTLMLLTYLEIAHARRTEDMGAGKQELFAMAKHFYERYNIS